MNDHYKKCLEDHSFALRRQIEELKRENATLRASLEAARPVADAGEPVAYKIEDSDGVAIVRLAKHVEPHRLIAVKVTPLFDHATSSARTLGLLREARAALGTWKDVAPAVSLCADIDKHLAAPSAPAEAPSVRAELETVHKFLLGEGPLDGFYFGDSDTARPRKAYWWREHLRRALQGKPEAPSTCAWTQADNENNIWDSACGETWSFNEGGPVENAIKFCQGCGKPVHIVPEAQKGGE